MSSLSPSTTPSPTPETEDKRPLIIYALPGSQFVFKVLAALQHRKIDHYVFLVPFDAQERSKLLPSGGRLVPELKVGTGPEATIVPDSEAILHWLNDHKAAARFYPKPECATVSERASTQKLAGLVWYYNWVNPKGYRNSMLKSIRQAIPWYVNWILPDALVGYALQSTRKKFRVSAATAIGVDDATLDNEQAMKQILVDELLYFQSLFKDNNDSSPQKYLIEGTTQPTAADFSVYAQVERLVGEGTASDVTVHPAIQSFKEQSRQEHGLTRLWEWHDHMRETCPVQFKGKRPPREEVSAA